MNNYKNTILYLLENGYNYLTVNDVASNLRIKKTRSVVVSIKRAIKTLETKGQIETSVVKTNNGLKLVAWRCGTSPKDSFTTLNSNEIERIIIRLFVYITRELTTEPRIEYNLMLNLVKLMVSKKFSIQGKRIDVSFHRAIKKLQNNKSIDVTKIASKKILCFNGIVE